jgi:hypothetical protein
VSRIWAALPLPDPLDQWHPLGACWWRRSLPADGDHNRLIIRTDQLRDDEAPRLGSWEWFDGQHVQAVFGVDVFGVAFSGNGAVFYLDVLALPEWIAEFGDQAKRWRNLTDPTSPDAARYPGDPSDFGPLWIPG